MYNESKTLAKLLDKVLAVKWPLAIEIICVNDASKDDSLSILKKYSDAGKVKIINNESNLGKSRSVKRGLLATTGDLVVIQDADLEYEPSDLLKFLKIFQDETVDVVYGNRFGVKNKIVYWSNWFGNRLLSLISSIFTLVKGGFVTSDMEVCYKMLRGQIFRDIAAKLVSSSGFGFEPELTARVAACRIKGKRLKFSQVPINYYPRTAAEGKHLKGLSDGYKALFEIVKFNLFVR